MIRIRAILKALYFGLMPYWVYEKVRHYECSYFRHLVINIRYAFRWVTYSEDESDRQFELKTNNNGKEAGK
jgi:hypothetical protein